MGSVDGAGGESKEVRSRKARTIPHPPRARGEVIGKRLGVKGGIAFFYLLVVSTRYSFSLASLDSSLPEGAFVSPDGEKILRRRLRMTE